MTPTVGQFASASRIRRSTGCARAVAVNRTMKRSALVSNLTIDRGGDRPTEGRDPVGVQGRGVAEGPNEERVGPGAGPRTALAGEAGEGVGPGKDRRNAGATDQPPAESNEGAWEPPTGAGSAAARRHRGWARRLQPSARSASAGATGRRSHGARDGVESDHARESIGSEGARVWKAECVTGRLESAAPITAWPGLEPLYASRPVATTAKQVRLRRLQGAHPSASSRARGPGRTRTRSPRPTRCGANERGRTTMTRRARCPSGNSARTVPGVNLAGACARSPTPCIAAQISAGIGSERELCLVAQRRCGGGGQG